MLLDFIGLIPMLSHAVLDLKTKPFRMDSYPDVLEPTEVAKILRIGNNKVYQLLQNSTIPSCKVGNQYRIPKKSLQAYLDTCYPTSADSLSENYTVQKGA